MAIIKCPECGQEVSSFAETCPHCGYRLKEKNSYLATVTQQYAIRDARSRAIGCVIGAIISGLASLLFFFMPVFIKEVRTGTPILIIMGIIFLLLGVFLVVMHFYWRNKTEEFGG